jgi:hypothetical protein
MEELSGAQDRKKETMKERRKKTIMSESLTTDN